MARSRRTFPELVNIKDRAVHETLRQNWQRTYDHDETLSSLQSQIEALQSAMSTVQSQIARLQEQITHALTNAD